MIVGHKSNASEMRMPSAPVITATDAPTFALTGIEFTGLAAPSLTREEVIVAIDGRARANVAGIEYELEAGGAVIVPADTDFALANPYAVPFRAVAVLPVGGAAVMNGETFVPPWAR